jgi:hypothetical protein
MAYPTGEWLDTRTGAQFEISIDGVPRTYRDRKDIALLAAQTLKSRNPNSVVKLKDLKTEGAPILAGKSASRPRTRPSIPSG